MMFDDVLSDMTLDDLKKLSGKIAKTIETFEERRRKAALASIEAIARDFGYSLDELAEIGKKSPDGKPMKYRNLEDPTQQWSGRGRQPAWFKQAIEAGTKPQDLLIKSQNRL